MSNTETRDRQKELQLTSGNNSGDRRALDHYPTPPDVTVALMEFLKLPPCRIWEPAAGQGAMSEVLKKYGHIVTSSDIKFNDYVDFATDYLVMKPIPADAIITNPPFNLSSDFIEKAIGEAKVVAMVLKSQYWHAKKRSELFEKHPPAWVLPLTWRPDFLNGEKGGAPTMEIVWTVWIEGQTDTRYRLLKKPTGKQLNIFQ
jgi:hypothetical protein